jgi:hypothetical protein
MVLIERSVETPRSPSMASRSLVGPTAGRLCRCVDLKEDSNQQCQYPRIPSKVLKGTSHEEVVDDVAAEVVNDEAWQSDVNLERMECRDTQISCIATENLADPLEACRLKGSRCRLEGGE